MPSSRHLAAIVFTDLVGFTASAQTDEPAALRRLEELEGMARPLAEEFSGRTIKSTGDGALLEFPSALQAALYSIELQHRLGERNRRSGGAPIELRIGIHVGDVEQRGDDIFGDAVNLASRIVGLADPGGVCLSIEAAGQVRSKVPCALLPLGPTTLKGVKEPVPLYRLVLMEPGAGSGPGTAPSPPRLAVLPLANISPDPSDGYFADGLTEELIAVLSRIPGLRVIARTSVSQYRASPKAIAQIGAELGVSHLLEGSVRKAGDRLRITLQLIDAQTQEHRWAETYNRKLDDVFAIQSEVAERTSEALRLELVGGAISLHRKPPTHDLAAYAAYLRAIHLWHGGRDVGTQPAIDLLEEAIRRDPTFSLAYAHLANILLQDLGDTRSGVEVFPRAQTLVAEALRLDPESAEAHAARGNYALQGEHDWRLAEAEFQRALQLNPSSGQAHAWYGLLLETLGRFDEAVTHFKQAIELDPAHWVYAYRLACTYCRMGRFGSAIELLASGIRARPDFPILRVNLARIYAWAGKPDEAEEELRMAVELSDERSEASADATGVTSVRWRCAAARGDLGPARSRLRSLTEKAASAYVPRTVIAVVLARLGRTDEALDLLEEDWAKGDRALWFVYQDPELETLRGNPRFEALLRNLALPSPK